MLYMYPSTTRSSGIQTTNATKVILTYESFATFEAQRSKTTVAREKVDIALRYIDDGWYMVMN